MKKGILFIAVCLSFYFVGCFSATEDERIVESRWKLIETRISPGGHVEFTPTEQEEIIEFLPDLKVKNSNGWCGDASNDTVTYSEDGVIHTNCNGGGDRLFEINGDIMIVRGSNCIEACDYKYRRVK